MHLLLLSISYFFTFLQYLLLPLRIGQMRPLCLGLVPSSVFPIQSHFKAWNTHMYSYDPDAW